jgi:hypothetical protein
MTEELSISELSDSFIRFIRKNIRFLLVFVGLCISIVITMFFVKPKIYKSKAICTSNIAQFEHNQEGQRSAVDVINFLNTFLDNNDYLGFSEVLDITLEDASAIKSLEAVQKYQIDLNEKYVEISNFEINLEILSHNKIIVLEDALLNYFHSNNYFQLIQNRFINGKEVLVSTLIQEIADLRNNRLKSLNKGIGVSTQVQAIENQILNLAKHIERTNYLIEVADSFVFIEKFSRPKKRSESLSYWLGMTFLISLLVGMIIVRIKEVTTR